jgi:hypothetical protein
VKLLALPLVALVAGATPLTVLPKPRFNAPAKEPKASGVRFVAVSSKYVGISPIADGPPVEKAFRGLPLLRLAAGKLEIYGKDGASGRYVVSPNRYAYDFARYAIPPRIRPGEREFVYEEVVWAQEAGGTLYVETAHSTYARSSYSLNAYLNAIDLQKRKLLWRSPALVANAHNFVVAGDVIVSGYGFTAEPDYLYAIDRSTGHVLTRLKLPNGPERITRSGSTFRVKTYDRLVVVRLER